MKYLPTLERLEDRIAPAGVVTLDFNAATKSLTLTGDSAANGLSVYELVPGTLVVAPTLGTTIQNAADPATPAGADPLIVTGFSGDLTIRTLGGEDSISIFHLSKVRNIVVQPGTESDGVTLSNVVIGGALQMTDPGGSNNAVLHNVSVKGDLTWSGGADSDQIVISGGLFSVGGNAAIRAGQGSNTLSVTAFDVKVGRLLSYTGSLAQADSLSMLGASLTAGSVSLDMGGGAINTFDLRAGEFWKVAGNLSLLLGDHSVSIRASADLQIPTLTVGGVLEIGSDLGALSLVLRSTKLAAKGGLLVHVGGAAGGNASQTNFNFGSATFGAVNISADASVVTFIDAAGKISAASLTFTGSATERDTFNLSAGQLAVAGRVKIDSGGGNDLVILNTVIAAGSMEVQLGAGNDSFTWQSSPFRGAKSVIKKTFTAFLGAGSDFFTVSGLLRAPISVAGDFTVNASDPSTSASDNVSLFNVKASKKLSVSATGGPATVNLNVAGLSVGGAALFEATTQMAAVITGSSFLGTFTLNGGTDSDFIEIAQGPRNDSVAATLFAKEVKISLGTGIDGLRIGSDQRFGAPTFRGLVTFEGGGDFDFYRPGSNAIFKTSPTEDFEG